MVQKNKWELLSITFKTELDNVLQQHHLAAQFIALAGRYLIPKKPDGSNINMRFLQEKEMLIGNQHPDGWAVGLRLKDLTVEILDKNLNVQTEIPLEGKSFDKPFQEFKTKLQNSGIDIFGLKTEQPYELPTTSLKDGLYFSIGKEIVVTENIRYRHNARLIINELAAGFTDVEQDVSGRIISTPARLPQSPGTGKAMPQKLLGWVGPFPTAWFLSHTSIAVYGRRTRWKSQIILRIYAPESG